MSESPGSQSPEEAKDDRPRTPYGVAVIALSVIGFWWWFVSNRSSSAFRETIRDQMFWIGVAGVLLVCAIVSILLLRKGDWLGRILTSLMLIGTGASFTAAYVVAIPKPLPETTYSVAVLRFVPMLEKEDEKDLAIKHRKLITDHLEDLKKRHSGEIDYFAIDRIPVGENQDLLRQDARRWALQRGCHLVLWADVEIGASSHQVTYHFLKVADWGQTPNTGFLSDESEFKLQGKSIDDAQVSRAITMVRYYWAVAAYEKGSYDLTIRELENFQSELGFYYSGASYFMKSDTSANPSLLLRKAVDYFRQLILINGKQKETDAVLDNRILYLRWWGRCLLRQLDTQTAADPAETTQQAVSVLSQALEAKKRRSQKDEALGRIEHSLALAYIHADDPNVAETHARNALSLFPQGSEDAANIHLTLAAAEAAKQASNEVTSLNRALAEVGLAIDQGEASPWIRMEGLRLRGSYLGLLSLEVDGDGRIEYDRAVQAFDESLDLCSQHTPTKCFDIRIGAAEVSLSWGNSQSEWDIRWKALERASTLTEKAAEDAHPSERPDLFARTRKLKARVHLAKAQESGPDLKKKELLEATTELGKGIDALDRIGSSAKELYEMRADCYRRLGRIEGNSIESQKFFALAKKDDRLAREPGGPLEFAGGK